MIKELHLEDTSYKLFFKQLADLTSLRLDLQDQYLIQQTVKQQSLKKKQVVWSAGDVCKHMVFIVRGSMRMYAIDEKGKEHTICLSIENEWICDAESFHHFTPSQYFMIAMEDCEIFRISYENLSNLKEHVAAIRKMVNINDYKNIIANQKRIHDAVYLTAEERFHQMMVTYPHFIKRFSQNILASYLGITFETLSRIRKQTA